MEGRRGTKANKAQEEEIETLQTRLSDLEIELDKKNVELKTVKTQRDQVVSELNHFQKELKNAKSQQTAAEDAEAQAKCYAEDMKVCKTRCDHVVLVITCFFAGDHEETGGVRQRHVCY